MVDEADVIKYIKEWATVNAVSRGYLIHRKVRSQGLLPDAQSN
jgi:hypothetical protein